MENRRITKLDILLFRAGGFFWGVSVERVAHIYWGIAGEDLLPLEPEVPALCFGSRPEFGIPEGDKVIPAVPLLSSTRSFDRAAFRGAAVVLQKELNRLAVLADEVVGTLSLDVERQIYLPPRHLEGVFKGKEIWGVAEEEGMLIYLIEMNFVPVAAAEEGGN